MVIRPNQIRPETDWKVDSNYLKGKSLPELQRWTCIRISSSNVAYVTCCNIDSITATVHRRYQQRIQATSDLRRRFSSASPFHPRAGFLTKQLTSFFVGAQRKKRRRFSDPCCQKFSSSILRIFYAHRFPNTYLHVLWLHLHIC